MAKRRRLEVPAEPLLGGIETKSAFPPPPKARMPIAEVAGDTAGRAALEEVAQAMTEAESEGRVVKKIPIAAIEIQHLGRDRMVLDEDEMAVLSASLAERGQQSPIEVLRVSGGRYGLISGMRRLIALRTLGETEILALVRRPDTAEAAYVAMVEENEVRTDLSFYERANVAVLATNAGVYPNPKRAISRLFAHSSSAKRSKIAKFVILRETLGKSLAFPAAIPERLGLELAAAIEADRAVAARISTALRKAPPADAAAERRTIERALKAPIAAAGAGARGEQIAPGMWLTTKKGRAVLTGVGVTEAFVEELRAWAVSHAKTSPIKY